MKFYLAASFSRFHELNVYREDLEALGHEVTSRWLDQEPTEEQLIDTATVLVEGDATDRADFAQIDLADIDAADVFVAFTHESGRGPARGSRHVEFGYAIDGKKKLIVVGPRENIFYYLPEVQQFDNFGDYLETL